MDRVKPFDSWSAAFATLCRIGVTCGLQPAIELVLDGAEILKQFEDLGPRPRRADPSGAEDYGKSVRRGDATHRNPDNDSNLPCARSTASIFGRAVERIAALSAVHQALHNTGHDNAARRFRFIALLTLVGER
jgi:hypothetical protein